MSQQPQNLANHVRLHPIFHFFLLPVMGITVVTTAYQAFRHLSPLSVWIVVLMAAAAIAVVQMRLYSLKVQDRVIRLEERIRLMSVLPEPLRARMGELTDQQYIGLRFASDGELPGLVQRALDEKLSLADIKKSIVNWRPDYFRV